VRRILTVIVLLMAPNIAGAADVDFSLNIDQISLTPRPTPKKEAQLAVWNSPMGRLMHNFNQQQAWVMRGTMPGGERVNGLAVSVKAQNGVKGRRRPLAVERRRRRSGDGSGRTALGPAGESAH